MPSVKQSDLEFLKNSLADHEMVAGQWRDKAQFAERRVRAFSDTLDKIVLAAQGRPLVDRGGGYGTVWGEGSVLTASNDSSSRERLETEIRALHEQLAATQARLAAAIAVAQFAKSQL